VPIAPLRSWQLGRRIRGQLPFAAVLVLLVAAGIYLLLFPGHWRRGVGIVALAMFVAAGFRWWLSRPHAGLLASRGKWADVICYLVLAVLILVVSLRLG
jgi:hypothetical protein